MNKIVLTQVMLIVVLMALGQTGKTIIITQKPQTVPTGKKWILEAGKPTKIQVSSGVFASGSKCNALFLSNHKMIFGLSKGENSPLESWGMILKKPEKVPYANDYTYYITPVSFVDESFSVSEFQQKTPEQIGSKRVIFYAGESVSVNNCLQSIELIESNMDVNDIQKANSKINYFDIPAHEKKAETRLHDEGLKQIVFECSTVIHNNKRSIGGLIQGANGLSQDDTWVITLSAQKLNLISAKGIKFDFTVSELDYNDTIREERFLLSLHPGQPPLYEIFLCWNSNQYLLSLNSLDWLETFTFSNVRVNSKQ